MALSRFRPAGPLEALRNGASHEEFFFSFCLFPVARFPRMIVNIAEEEEEAKKKQRRPEENYLRAHHSSSSGPAEFDGTE